MFFSRPWLNVVRKILSLFPFSRWRNWSGDTNLFKFTHLIWNCCLNSILLILGSVFFSLHQSCLQTECVPYSWGLGNFDDLLIGNLWLDMAEWRLERMSLLSELGMHHWAGSANSHWCLAYGILRMCIFVFLPWTGPLKHDGPMPD